MTADRYVLLQLQKGATIHECQDCGAVIFHRTIHDAWHALTEQEATIVAQLCAGIVRHLGLDDDDDLEVDDELDVDTGSAVLARLVAEAAIEEYGSSERRN